MEYRRRLYAHYVSTHLAPLRDMPIGVLKEQIEKQRAIYHFYFGCFLPRDKSARVLDIGCGHGAFLHFLQREGYNDVAGVDVSPEQIEIARRLAVPNVQCADTMGFLREHLDEFDCITALDVVEHFQKEEVLPLFDAIYEALRSGGTFIMQSPNADGPFGGRYRYSDFTHELSFTKRSITQILSVAGFIDIKVVPTGPVAHGFISAGRWFLWRLISALLMLYLGVETGSFRGHILTQTLIATARKPSHVTRRDGYG